MDEGAGIYGFEVALSSRLMRFLRGTGWGIAAQGAFLLG